MNVCALLSLSVLSAKAQTTYMEMEQLTVNDQVTTVITASEPIRFVDISTDKVVGDQPINNTIRLKPKDNVYAYPNPVTPDYTGDITIVGLSYNADVKIVTTNGTLVNQGRSTGGSYRWNGCDLKGKRVASGIYMVETATEDGSKGTVCKIAIIN